MDKCTIDKWNSNNINKYDPFLFENFNIPIISFDEYKTINKILDNENLIKKYQYSKENRENLLKHFFGKDFETSNATEQIIN